MCSSEKKMDETIKLHGSWDKNVKDIALVVQSFMDGVVWEIKKKISNAEMEINTILFTDDYFAC